MSLDVVSTQRLYNLIFECGSRNEKKNNKKPNMTVKCFLILLIVTVCSPEPHAVHSFTMDWRPFVLLKVRHEKVAVCFA